MSTLSDRYRGVLWDVDGVIVEGDAVLPGAVETWTAVQHSCECVIVTNNASRTPTEVASMVARHGVMVADKHVVTSSVAAASVVRERWGEAASVLAVGGTGVVAALRAAGLSATPAAEAISDDGWDVVVQGLGATVSWEHLARAAAAIHAGAGWVATNTDSTLPTHRGVLPGNGALVGAVQVAVPVEPTVVGKPHAPIYRCALSAISTEEVSPSSVVMVGDRLETDTEGGNSAGCDTLWVATGVHTLVDVALAPPAQRPTWVAPTAEALLLPPPEKVSIAREEHSVQARCGLAAVTIREGVITHNDQGQDISMESALQCGAAWVHAVWAARDAGTTISPEEVARTVPRGGGW